MSKVSVPSKELKDALKMLMVLADASKFGNTSIIISQTDENPARTVLTLVNDYVQAQYFFKESQIATPLVPFVFDPQILEKIAPSNKMITLAWSDNAVLNIEDGKFKSNLRIGIRQKFEGYHPPTDVQVRVSGSLLAKLFEYCILPGVYHKTDLAQLPVRVYGENGFLCGSYDDAFSLMKMQTEAVFSDRVNIQLPRYVADALMNIDLDEELSVGVGQEGFRVVLIGKNFTLSCTGLQNELVDIDSAIEQQGAVAVSAKFDPKMLSDAIKPLVKLIPAKDKSAAYIVAQFDDGKLSITMRHRELGDASHDQINGISDMYIERGLKSTHAHMHPAGFQAYTQLLNTPVAVMQVYGKAVLYKCQEEIGTQDGKVKATRSYLFPAVEI